VNIPPLRDRREEIIPYLLAAVEKRRADNGEPRRQIAIDKRVEHVLMHQLQYPNNFADLERIADRIRPEENTITFSHLRELYEREVLFDLREEIRSRFGTIEGCIQYFKEIDGGKDSVAWTDLASLFDLRPSEVYTLGCSLFVHLKRSTWPANDDEIAKYFGVGQTAEGFKGFMSRLSNEIKPGVRPSEAIQNWIKGLNDGRNAPIPSARSQERSDRIVKRRRPSQSRIELEQ
jgi:hypothetical protein